MASDDAARTVLLRNPNYHGTRPRRAERIVYIGDTPTPQAVALADSGDIDVVPSDWDRQSLLAPGGILDERYGAASAAARAGRQRYFREQSLPLLDFIVFNAQRPLFRDVRLRRAVEYALDRRALSAAYDDSATDAIIPPAIPGYRTSRLYPIEGPDLRMARRLEGRRARHAVLAYFCGDPAQATIAQIVRSNLARIGIAVSIVGSDACPERYGRTTEHADLFLAGWPFGLGSQERDPAPILDEVLATGRYGSAIGAGPWSQPAFRQRVERARALRGRARIEAYTQLQDELLRAAPYAVYGGWLYREYFSPRVGCKVFQAEYRFVDLGALCVPKHR
jgi:ABC-type transport system substrate-binding protein